jgi:hypothetical protein
MHLVGLSLGVGAATVKMLLLIKCKSDYFLVSVYLKVSKIITKLILIGIILLTLSGIGWLLHGYPFTDILIVKIILVVTIWILGPFINKIEPKFQKLVPGTDQTASVEFISVLKKYLILEIIATGLFYCVIVIWIFG